MKDEDKIKVEPIKELKTIRKEREKSALNNITEGKPAEEALKESEEKYRNLIESANESIISVDLQGKLLTLNSRAISYLGGLAENYIGKTLWDIFPKKIAEERFAELQKVIQSGEQFVKESYLPFQGKTRCFLNSMQPIKNRAGDIYAVLILANDITEHKQAEKDLAESEEKYRTVFENTGTATAIIEEDMTLSTVNARFEKLIGYSKEEIENKLKWTDYVLKEDLERMKKYHIARREAGEKPPTKYEFRLKDKKGSIKSILLKIGMISNTKKSVASLTDITELKQGEERIKHLNLVIRAVRNVNQLIIKEKDRERLLKGICNNLIKTRGYYHSLIVLLDEEGKIDTYAEAGLGKDFLPMLKRLKKGELTVFGQLALKQEEVVIIKDPASACLDCPLVQACSEQGSVMTVRLEHDGKICGIMSVSIPAHFVTDKEEQALFKEVAGDVALGLHSIKMEKKLDKQTHDLQQNYQKTKRAMDATIETMSKIVEAKDPYTAGHQQRVSQLATVIAKELNFSEDKIEGIRIASLIHDIGKIGLPTEILSKPTKLSDIEFSLIKEHPQIGYNILKSIDFYYPVAKIVLQHHERLDGSGYPNHLKGDKIFLEAKIIGIADVVEAMSSHRPYRPALGVDKALEEISQNRGILYDPKVVDICLNLFKEKGFKFE